MSSRDKSSLSNKATSKKTSNKSKSNRAQPPLASRGRGGGGSANASKHAVSVSPSLSIVTRGGEKKNCSKKASGPQRSELEKNQGFDEKLVDIDENDKFKHEMASTNYSNSPFSSNIIEQETDLDDESGDTLSGSTKETSGLLSHASSTTIEPEGSKLLNEKDLLAGSSIKDDSPVEESPLPPGWEQHSDKQGLYYWHVSSGTIQRDRPLTGISPKKDCPVFYHDDEEINQAQKTSSDDDDYYESGAALTIDDTSESTFVVYPLGCSEFDETHLVSVSSSKAIQKCILRLANRPSSEESNCWGLDQNQPVLMKLFDDHIQFTDIKSQTLLRSQPIQTIKTWAVDDDNNFAFVIEERFNPANAQEAQKSDDFNYYESADYALLNEPSLVCYVFRSMDDDDMSCKVASKLTEEINRYREQISDRVSKSTRLQQMVEKQGPAKIIEEAATDEDLEELEATNELIMNVKYIGKTPVPRPTGIDVLNVAIDKCLADASRVQGKHSLVVDVGDDLNEDNNSPLIEAKLYVSPSSVIVENVISGEIIVECRIRFLTFMGISRRDIRWCGFIMQNPTNKSFVAHCFECYPTAGHVCEAIQLSCTRMYEKVVKNSRKTPPETTSIIPSGSKIRNTLAKTLSRIKLNPIT